MMETFDQKVTFNQKRTDIFTCKYQLFWYLHTFYHSIFAAAQKWQTDFVFFSSSIPFSAHSYFKKVSFYCIRLNHTVLFFISTMFGTCWLLRTVFIFHFLFRLLLDFIFFQQRIVIITCKLTWIYRTFGYNRCIKLNHLVSQSKLQTAFANIDVIWCIESAEK